MSRALVLSGGGPVGIGWEAGVVSGLRSEGVDLTEADFVVGTSAGSVVGAQVARGGDMAEITAGMRGGSGGGGSDGSGSGGSGSDPASSGAVGASAGLTDELMTAFTELFTSDAPEEVKRATVGAFALAAETMPEDAFVGVFGQLDGVEWPRRYSCTAVDAETGAFMVWDGTSGEPLVRAVASSCAVPGIFPPITIDGRRYIDGGMRSITNADLAEGHDRVLILSLMDPAALVGPMTALAAGFDREVATLRGAGGEVEVVYPDAEAASAMGVNLMDPALVGPAEKAGERQGRLLANRLAGFWTA
jgi:NTE family protein